MIFSKSRANHMDKSRHINIKIETRLDDGPPKITKNALYTQSIYIGGAFDCCWFVLAFRCWCKARVALSLDIYSYQCHTPHISSGISYCFGLIVAYAMPYRCDVMWCVWWLMLTTWWRLRSPARLFTNIRYVRRLVAQYVLLMLACYELLPPPPPHRNIVSLVLLS